MSVTPYPWQLLDRVAQPAVRAARAVRRRLEDAVRLEGLAAALGETLSGEVSIVARRLTPASLPPPTSRSLVFETADRALVLTIEPEPALATLALARVLGQAEPFPDPTASLAA